MVEHASPASLGTYTHLGYDFAPYQCHGKDNVDVHKLHEHVHAHLLTNISTSHSPPFSVAMLDLSRTFLCNIFDHCGDGCFDEDCPEGPRRTTVTVSELFYLKHSRSCAAGAGGSMTTGGGAGSAVCGWIGIVVRELLKVVCCESDPFLDVAFGWQVSIGTFVDAVFLALGTLRLEIRLLHFILDLPVFVGKCLMHRVLSASVNLDFQHWEAFALMSSNPVWIIQGYAIFTSKAGYTSWALGACLLFGVHFDSPYCRALGSFSALLVPASSWMCQGLLVGKCYVNPGFPIDANNTSYGPTREPQGTQNSLRQHAAPYSEDNGGSLGAGQVHSSSAPVDGIQQNIDDLSNQLNRGARIVGQQDARAGGRVRFYCPVPSCIHHDVRNNTGWATKQGLKTHIDAHLSGSLLGNPTDDFLRLNGWVNCPICNLTAAANRRGGVHDSCAQAFATSGGHGSGVAVGRDDDDDGDAEGYVNAGGERSSSSSVNNGGAANAESHRNSSSSNELARLQEYESNLPTFEQISTLAVTPKEHTSKGLHGKYREIHGKLVARANECCVFDAWEVGLGNPDNVPKAKTRIAWTEEAMFSKAVLCRDKRSLKKQQAYAAAKNKLDRWEQGERKTLWESIHVPKQQKKKKAASEEQRIQRVNNLAQKGKAGKAIQAATSPGLAMDTQDVEDMLTSKFPRRLQENRNRPIPPFQHQATREEVVKEIRSFGQGATPGHLGLWPQFLKEMVGAEGDQDIINVYVERVQVFLDGRAPAYMHQWYGGGRLVGIGKDDEPLDKDARPLVVGETWRRLVEKVGLRGEGIQNPESDFVGFLKKYQVAIGVKAGSEVIIHTLRQWCLRNKGASGIALLKRDYANAFNTADEHELLTACHEWLPGCARFAEWCYGETVNLIYHGRILHSHKGQQGSPLTMPMFCSM